MTESISFMKVIEQIDSKLDDIRDKLTETMIMTSGTQIKQAMQEKEIETLKIEVSNLKSSYDKATGAYKLAMAPGVLSLIWAISQILLK